MSIVRSMDRQKNRKEMLQRVFEYIDQFDIYALYMVGKWQQD